MDMAIAVKVPTTNIGDMATEETVEKEKTAKDGNSTIIRLKINIFNIHVKKPCQKKI